MGPLSFFSWWRVRDLNPGPTDYDSAALTTELTRRRTRYFTGVDELLHRHRLIDRPGRGIDEQVALVLRDLEHAGDLRDERLVEFLRPGREETEIDRDHGEVHAHRR